MTQATVLQRPSALRDEIKVHANRKCWRSYPEKQLPWSFRMVSKRSQYCLFTLHTNLMSHRGKCFRTGVNEARHCWEDDLVEKDRGIFWLHLILHLWKKSTGPHAKVFQIFSWCVTWCNHIKCEKCRKKKRIQRIWNQKLLTQGYSYCGSITPCCGVIVRQWAGQDKSKLSSLEVLFRIWTWLVVDAPSKNNNNKNSLVAPAKLTTKLA